MEDALRKPDFIMNQHDWKPVYPKQLFSFLVGGDRVH